MQLTRRDAVLALCASLMAKVGFAQGSTLPTTPAVLTIDLSQWKELVVMHGEKAIVIPSAEIFEALS